MKRTCNKLRPDLSAYLDGELRAEDRQRVKAHLERCARCRCVLDQWKRIGSTLAGSCSVTLRTGSLSERVLDRVRGEASSREPAAPWVALPALRWAAVLVAVLCGVLAAWLVLPERPGGHVFADRQDEPEIPAGSTPVAMDAAEPDMSIVARALEMRESSRPVEEETVLQDGPDVDILLRADALARETARSSGASRGERIETGARFDVTVASVPKAAAPSFAVEAPALATRAARDEERFATETAGWDAPGRLRFVAIDAAWALGYTQAVAHDLEGKVLAADADLCPPGHESALQIVLPADNVERFVLALESNNVRVVDWESPEDPDADDLRAEGLLPARRPGTSAHAPAIDPAAILDSSEAARAAVADEVFPRSHRALSRADRTGRPSAGPELPEGRTLHAYCVEIEGIERPGAGAATPH